MTCEPCGDVPKLTLQPEGMLYPLVSTYAGTSSVRVARRHGSEPVVGQGHGVVVLITRGNRSRCRAGERKTELSLVRADIHDAADAAQVTALVARRYELKRQRALKRGDLACRQSGGKNLHPLELAEEVIGIGRSDVDGIPDVLADVNVDAAFQRRRGAGLRGGQHTVDKDLAGAVGQPLATIKCQPPLLTLCSVVMSKPSTPLEYVEKLTWPSFNWSTYSPLKLLGSRCSMMYSLPVEVVFTQTAMAKAPVPTTSGPVPSAM